jgi:hypothetical protein
MKLSKLILVFFIPIGLSAQSNIKRYMFKMSPQHLTLKMLRVGVERLNNNQTKGFSLYLFGAANDKENFYSNFPYTGGGAEIQARKYLNTFTNKTNSQGQSFAQSVYLAGFAQGGIFRWGREYSPPFTSQADRYKYDKNIALGFSIGLQRTVWKILILDVFAGGGFQKGWSEASLATPIRYSYQNSRFSGPGYTGVLPKGGLMLGIYLK